MPQAGDTVKLEFDMTAPRPVLKLDEIQLSERDFWCRPRNEREGAFLTLRDERPVSFHHEIDQDVLPAGPGYWSLTRHEHVRQANRDTETFLSGKGTNIIDIPDYMLEFFGSMINMDAPRHTKMRRIVYKAFTPRRVRVLEDYVADKAKEVIARVVDRGGEFDFVAEVAAPFPLEIICEMMGVPRPRWQRVYELTNIILSSGDPEFGTTIKELLEAAVELSQIAKETGLDHQKNPADDLVSDLVNANVDGEHLSAEEFASFFILLVAAGNETTRTAASHGLLALSQNPDQRALLKDDLERHLPGLVEEILRWSTPVMHFRRTASRDVVIGGQQIKEGDKVVLWYNSANRDERVFDNPYRFDITRDPNEHLGFGGGGAHFCLGANLARRELSVLFRELLTELPDIEVTGEPAMLESNFIHGVKRVQCRG